MFLPSYRTIIIQPQIVKIITQEEYEQLVLERAARNFNEYALTIDALDMNREGLTARQASQLTKRSVYRERKNLRRLHDAAFIGKRGHRYFITDENLEDIRRTFGPKAILLSANFMTEREKEIEYNIING